MSIVPAGGVGRTNGGFTSTMQAKGSSPRDPEVVKCKVTMGFLYLVANKPEALGALPGRAQSSTVKLGWDLEGELEVGEGQKADFDKGKHNAKLGRAAAGAP